MPTYQLTIQFSKESTVNFIDIERILQNNNATFVKYLSNSYIINYTYLAGVLSKEIKKLPFHTEDKFMIIKVLDNYSGTLDNESWEGIKNSFNK